MAIVSEGGSAGAVSPFPLPLCEGKQKERFALNVLVVGSGRLGRYLANMLDEEGHDVAIVENRRHRKLRRGSRSHPGRQPEHYRFPNCPGILRGAERGGPDF